MTGFAAYRRVLRQPGFRRYFVGESVSSVGDAMSEITVVLLALGLARHDLRPAAVALASAAYLVPGVLTGIVAGPSIGGSSPRTLLLVDNTWRGGWLGLAAILEATGVLRLGPYLGLLALASLSRPLGAAGSRAIIAQLAPEDGLFAANSLVNTVVQAATMLGPGAAGILIALVGLGPVLGIDAVSFLLFAIALLTISQSAIHPAPGEWGPESAGEQVMTAGRFRTRATWLLQYPDIAGIFALTALFHVLYGPFVVGLPLLVAARTGASSTATVLGALWSAFGLGAVLGGLLAGHRLSLATARTAALIAAGWGGVTVVVALPAHLGVAVVAMLVGGMIYAPYLAIVSTIMQHRLHRRRLAEASAYLSSLTGLAGPFGTLLGGVTVAVAGARWTLTAAGGTLVAVGVGFAVRFGATTAPRTPGGTVAGDEATQGVGT